VALKRRATPSDSTIVIPAKAGIQKRQVDDLAYKTEATGHPVRLNDRHSGEGRNPEIARSMTWPTRLRVISSLTYKTQLMPLAPASLPAAAAR
jgi:hypothetical protein